LTKIPAFNYWILSLGIIFLVSFSTVQADYQPQSSVPGYGCYRDYDSIIQSIEGMEIDHPELVQISTLGN